MRSRDHYKTVLGLAASFVAGATLCAVQAADIPLSERRSGYDQMSRTTQAMQDDDNANPGMFWVLDGAALWQGKNNPAQKSCHDCHGDAQQTMRGVAARHPVVEASNGSARTMESQINLCRTERQNTTNLPYESKELLALSAFLARQSRTNPVTVADDPATRAAIARGRDIWQRRQGQLNLSCASCHDDNWDRKLAGAPIPQAHPTGYPVYRLEWQALGSLQRRFRNCMTGMRADAYPFGAPEFADLEVFLKWRARGMPMESPAVRP